MRLLECSFLIPIRRDRNLSDGKRHRKETWDWLEGRLYVLGGATQATQLYSGWYVDSDTGKRVDDDSRKYFVALSRADVDRLRAVLREARRVFQQKCIYLSVAGHVEFVEGVSDDEG
jgi:hypothetical protein